MERSLDVCGTEKRPGAAYPVSVGEFAVLRLSAAAALRRSVAGENSRLAPSGGNATRCVCGAGPLSYGFDGGFRQNSLGATAAFLELLGEMGPERQAAASATA